MFPFPSHGDYRRKNLFQELTDLGLTTNLKVCLDAGDLASYGNQTDKWMDLSGNGYDFFKGSGTGADGGDPTFNGVTGNRSINEYFSSDGGDYFTYDTTNETWMQNLHKNGAIWSFCAWVYIPTGYAANHGLFGTSSNAGTRTGIVAYIDQPTNRQSVAVFNASAAVYTFAQAATITTNAWNFIGWSLDENAGGNNTSGITNGTTFDIATSYSSPSSGAASYPMQIGGLGNNTRPLVNNARMANFNVWEGTKLTASNFSDIYNRTKGKFGL